MQPKLGITRNGVNTLITEKQATDIKNSIAKSGRNDLDNVVQLENVSTESEENEIVMQDGLTKTCIDEVKLGSLAILQS